MRREVRHETARVPFGSRSPGRRAAAAGHERRRGTHAAARPTPGPSCRPDGAGMEICDATACTFLASVAPRAQEESNWCWAACLEMAFSCLGNRVTQQTIVKATWGDIRNVPASPADIVKTVNREYVNILGGRFRPKAKLLDRTFTIFTNIGALAETFDHVAAGKPAIVGTLNPGGTGHATMLTHLSVRSKRRSRGSGALFRPRLRSLAGTRERGVHAGRLEPHPVHRPDRPSRRMTQVVMHL